jgi:hypothetical protein
MDRRGARARRGPNDHDVARGIRLRVWVAGGLMIAPVVAALVTHRPDEAGSARDLVTAARPAPAPAIASVPAPPEPATRSIPVSRESEDEHAASRPDPHFTKPSGSDPEARSRVDSRLEAELRILEDDAARRAESIGGARAVSVSASEQQAARGGDEARRIALADAFLVEHLVQETYRATQFPVGYPAEQRTREATTSLVASFDPEQRRSQLEVALQAPAEEPIGPRFEWQDSGLTWQAASQ